MSTPHRGDFRDFVSPQMDNDWRLYPYAKDLYYHPASRTVSMTVEIYNDTETKEFSFGFVPTGALKDFMDQLWDEDDE
jgi:hypothetical protein